MKLNILTICELKLFLAVVVIFSGSSLRVELTPVVTLHPVLVFSSAIPNSDPKPGHVRTVLAGTAPDAA